MRTGQRKKKAAKSKVDDACTREMTGARLKEENITNEGIKEEENKKSC